VAVNCLPLVGKGGLVGGEKNSTGEMREIQPALTDATDRLRETIERFQFDGSTTGSKAIAAHAVAAIEIH
jgi:hypothetical protein